MKIGKKKMKKINLSNGVELRLCSADEWKGYVNSKKYPKLTMDSQMYYVYRDREKADSKDLFLAKEEDSICGDRKTLMSNIIRVISSHKLGDVAGQAEDGYVLSANEILNKSAEFKFDVEKLASELTVDSVDVDSITRNFESKLKNVWTEAKRGNILTEEETDHMAFDLAADLYRSLGE